MNFFECDLLTLLWPTCRIFPNRSRGPSSNRRPKKFKKVQTFFNFFQLFTKKVQKSSNFFKLFQLFRLFIISNICFAPKLYKESLKTGFGSRSFSSFCDTCFAPKLYKESLKTGFGSRSFSSFCDTCFAPKLYDESLKTGYGSCNIMHRPFHLHSQPRVQCPRLFPTGTSPHTPRRCAPGGSGLYYNIRNRSKPFIFMTSDS